MIFLTPKRWEDVMSYRPGYLIENDAYNHNYAGASKTAARANQLNFAFYIIIGTV